MFEQENSANGKCANCRLSQQKGSPQLTVPIIVPTAIPCQLFNGRSCIGYANHPPRQLVVWGLAPTRFTALSAAPS